jgi:phenylacetate-CoA ligase
VHLESWLHQRIKNSVLGDTAARVTRAEVEDYHIARLRDTVRYCFERSTFYRDLLRSASLIPDEIRSLKDLSRIPFTEPDHVAEGPFRFLCTSQAEVARPYTFITSGTTGPKKRIFWTHGDLDRIVDFMGAGIGTVAHADDTVLILLPDGRPYSQADLLFRGVNKIGAIPVVASMDLSAQELFAAVKETRCAVIFGYTRRLFRLTMELQRKHDLHELGVRVLFLAAEYLPDAMRQQIQSSWGAHVHTHYGLTEMGLGVAVECEAGNGYHFNEADLLVEIVHPRTGELMAEGEEGELVFTTLNREAMPLLRYRTHDLSRLIPEPCPCGASSLLKIDKVKKRLENIVRIGDGDEMYPALFDDLLFEIPGLVDYQVTVTNDSGKDRLDFRLEVLPGETSLPEISKKLLAAPIISGNLSGGKMLAPRIELAGPGSLATVSREKKMVLDHR